MVEDLLGQEASRSPRPTSFGQLGALLFPFSSSTCENTGVFSSGGSHASKGRDRAETEGILFLPFTSRKFEGQSWYGWSLSY